jgi:hypothetical protein
MLFIGAIGFGLVVWAGMLWGAIALIDRHNAYNRFPTALIWSALNVAAAFVLREIALLGLFVGIAYLVLMIKVLMRHYELGILQTLGVLGLLIAAPHVLMPPLLGFVETSELRAILVLFGLPLGIIAIWLVGRYKARRRVEDVTADGLPQARVVKRAPTSDVRPAELPAAPVPEVPAPPPIAPIATSAPEPVAPASPTEGPRFLR